MKSHWSLVLSFQTDKIKGNKGFTEAGRKAKLILEA